MSEQSPQEFHQPKEGLNPLYDKLLSKMVKVLQLKGAEPITAENERMDILDPDTTVGRGMHLISQDQNKAITFDFSLYDESGISLQRQDPKNRINKDIVAAGMMVINIHSKNDVHKNEKGEYFNEGIEIVCLLDSEEKTITGYCVHGLYLQESGTMMREELKKLGINFDDLTLDKRFPLHYGYFKEANVEQTQGILDLLTFMEKNGTINEDSSAT